MPAMLLAGGRRRDRGDPVMDGDPEAAAGGTIVWA